MPFDLHRYFYELGIQTMKQPLQQLSQFIPLNIIKDSFACFGYCLPISIEKEAKTQAKMTVPNRFQTYRTIKQQLRAITVSFVLRGVQQTQEKWKNFYNLNFLYSRSQQRAMLPNLFSTDNLQQNSSSMFYVPVDPHLLMKLVQNQQFLVWQVNSLQIELQSLKAKLEAANHEQNSGSSSLPRKCFKKDHHCQERGCTKKYSSRIALRAHQRKEHLRNESNNSSYSP